MGCISKTKYYSIPYIGIDLSFVFTFFPIDISVFVITFLQMDDSSLDILPGIDDIEVKQTSSPEPSFTEKLAESELSIKTPLLPTPIRPVPQENPPVKVLKYTPAARGRGRYEQISEPDGIVDVTQTPAPISSSTEISTDPSESSTPEACPANVKQILLQFINSFLSVIQPAKEHTDLPQIATTALGNRVPFVPISAETVRKFGHEHPPASQMLATLSSNTIPLIPTEAPPTDKEEDQSNLRRDSLVASHITPDMRHHLLAIASKRIEFGHSVEIQNGKSEKIFLHFCKEMDMTPYPIHTETLLAFLVWVAESRRFTAYSIDCVLYASLCRLNVIRSGIYIDPMTQYAARAMIASFDPTMKPRRGGMLPIIPDDVSRMVEAMDFRDPKSYALAALFTFALSTGARGNSCSNVRLCDLGPLYEKDDSSCLLVVTIVKLKGRPTEKLQLTLAGSLTVRSPVDVVYWLNQHLVHTFHVSLPKLLETPESSGVNYQSLLWPYSTDAMTQYVKSRLEAGGMSSEQFGFHSFRSGFLASSLIQGEKRGEPISDVLVRCALVTGWKALGSVEFSYIREAARRRILPTNMIGTTSAEPFMKPSSMDDPDAGDASQWRHANSFEYHIFKKPVPTRKRKSFLFQIKRFLSDTLWVKDASESANRKYIDACYLWSLRRLGKGLFEIGEYAEEDLSRFKTKTGLYRHLGFEYLDRETRSHPETFEVLAEEIITELRNNGKIKTSLPPVEEKPSQNRSLTVAPRIFTERRTGRCRKRLEWSETEERRLVDGIEKGELIDEIVVDLPARNVEDLYFHVRHLNKKRAAQNLPPLVWRRRPAHAKRETANQKDHQSQTAVDHQSQTAVESSSNSHGSGSSDDHSEENMEVNSSSDSTDSDDSDPHPKPPPRSITPLERRRLIGGESGGKRYAS